MGNIKWLICFLVLNFGFKVNAYSQRFYLGMNEDAIRKHVSKRAILHLETEYSADGEKFLCWTDMELKVYTVIGFDSRGIATGYNMFPPSPKEINKWKEYFSQKAAKQDVGLWILKIKDDATYKILLQYYDIFEKYGFKITRIE